VNRPPAVSAVGALCFDQTVPRQLAHRRGLAEVFVADTAKLGVDEFAAALQAPRAHSLWHDQDHDLHDPLVVVEACRQAIFVGLHRYWEVPVGTPGSLQRFDFRVLDLGAYRDDHANPLAGIAQIQLTLSRTEGGEGGVANFAGRIVIGGREAMTVEGTILLFRREDFEVLRAHQRAAKPLLPRHPPASRLSAPKLVGRRDIRNVVIGDAVADGVAGEEQRYPVFVDTGNPAFFDHPNDHLPGPLIVEAYRQAAIRAATRVGSLAAPRAVATGCRAEFVDFAEYEGPIECSASVAASVEGEVPVRVGLQQFDKEVAEADLVLREVPPSGSSGQVPC